MEMFDIFVASCDVVTVFETSSSPPSSYYDYSLLSFKVAYLFQPFRSLYPSFIGLNMSAKAMTPAKILLKATAAETKANELVLIPIVNVRVRYASLN